MSYHTTLHRDLINTYLVESNPEGGVEVAVQIQQKLVFGYVVHRGQLAALDWNGKRVSFISWQLNFQVVFVFTLFMQFFCASLHDLALFSPPFLT